MTFFITTFKLLLHIQPLYTTNDTLSLFLKTVHEPSAKQNMSGAVPMSVHDNLMLSYSNVLYIPTVDIKAKVFDGMDKSNLSRGVARDLNTVKIGEYGNLYP